MKRLVDIENACVPIALRFAAKVPEGKVIEKCLSVGMSDFQWLHAAKTLGLKLDELKMKPMMVKEFSIKYPLGTFIVSTWAHLFVIEDGVVHDPAGKKPGTSRTVLYAYRVIS